MSIWQDLVVVDGGVSWGVSVSVDSWGMSSVHSRSMSVGNWSGVRVDGWGSGNSLHNSWGMSVGNWGSMGVDSWGSMGVDGRGGMRVDGRGGMGVDSWGSSNGLNDGWGAVGNWSGNGLDDGWGGVGNDSWSSMDRWARFGDDSVESVNIIGGVVDGADGTIGFNQGVLSLHNISITALDLGFHISGETIMDSIVKGVLRVRVVISLVFSGQWDDTSGGDSEESQADNGFAESHF